jgi:hypothetical protein
LLDRQALLDAKRQRFRQRLDVGAKPKIGGELHRIAAAVRTHMGNALRQLFEQRPRALDVLDAATHHRQQRSAARLWNGSEHRRLDQPCAARFDQRRELAACHGLQRAHLDEQFSLHVAGEKAVGAAENAPHPVIFRDAGDHNFGIGGNRSGVVGDAQSVRRQRLIRAGVVVPTDHVKALLT